MTDVYEGSLIRLFRRLEELLRQMAQAAKVMGSEELEQKFTAALELVRRDLVAVERHWSRQARSGRFARHRPVAVRGGGAVLSAVASLARFPSDYLTMFLVSCISNIL